MRKWSLSRRLPLTILLFYFLARDVEGSAVGTLTVRHRLKKEDVLYLSNVVVNSKLPIPKGRLFVSSPAHGCRNVQNLSTADGNTVSLQGDLGQRSNFLLLSDEMCNIRQKTRNAKKAGYSGIFVYSDKKEIEDMSVYTEVFVGLLSSNDGKMLQKFAKPQYSINFEHDMTLLESVFDIYNSTLQYFYQVSRSTVNFFAAKKKSLSLPVRNLFVNIFEVLLLLTPILFLLCFVKKELPSYNEAPDDFHDFFGFNSTSGGSWNSQSNSSAKEDEKPISEYRTILGVSEHCCRTEVEKAFKKRCIQLHPDKNMHLSEEEREQKTDEFKSLMEARKKVLKAIEKLDS